MEKVERLLIATATIMTIIFIGGYVAMYFDCYTTALRIVKNKF